MNAFLEFLSFDYESWRAILQALRDCRRKKGGVKR
jgi:hypothetical protein